MKAERFKVFEKIMQRYSVNLETGEVFHRKFQRILKPAPCRGYLMLSFKQDGKQYSYAVHEIVAYFGGLDIVDTTINHKDGNKLNNSFSNLEVMPRAENTKHAWENGLIYVHSNHAKGSKNGRSKLCECEVKEIRSLWDSGAMKQKDIAERYGIHPNVVSRIVNRKAWSHLN